MPPPIVQSFDVPAMAGSFLGVLALVGGQLLEGGHVGQILQGTAALIVLGGTAGATLLSFPMDEVRLALRAIPAIYRDTPNHISRLVEEASAISLLARKEGLLALEAARAELTDPVLKRGIGLVLDGQEPAAVREILEAESELVEENEEVAARIFESAGGYAPTIGILGAVLGLIHVMSMLDQPARIGEGIAVAFVATIYGVGLSNLILLPWAARIKRRSASHALHHELARTAVLGIQEGVNPMFLREKLEVFANRGLKPGMAPGAARR